MTYSHICLAFIIMYRVYICSDKHSKAPIEINRTNALIKQVKKKKTVRELKHSKDSKHCG